MEAARRSRLRLSRRRPPSGDQPPSPGLGSGPDADGDGERARLWAELLRTVSADANGDEEPPPLPAFPSQQPTRDPERAASPEVFTVGSRTFSWTPLPPAPRGTEGPGRSYRVLRGAGGLPRSPARSPQGCNVREPGGDLSAQAQPAADRAQPLRSCPMCQADFAPGLTQLDVDSHFAQCLAGSTEDVGW